MGQFEATTRKPELDQFRAPYFFLSSDIDRRLFYVSPSVQSVLGFRPEVLIGQIYDDFIDAENSLYESVADPDSFTTTKVKAAYGETLHAVNNVDGEPVVLRVASYTEYSDPVTRQNPIAFHCLLQDVSDVYRVEQLLQNHLMVLGKRTIQISEREQQVLNFLLAGRLNKSIAREIDITERGVERIRARLMSKFGAKSAAELARKATIMRLSTDLQSVSSKFSPMEGGDDELHLFDSLLTTTQTSSQ